MEDNSENKIDTKDRVIYFLKKNKKKSLFILLLLIVSASSIVGFQTYKFKQNSKIAEKYITAGIYFNSDEKEKSKRIYEEILYSKNKFYSILALNTILEKDLENNKEKILNYFYLLENINYTKEQKDLIKFKKALYLLKLDSPKEANKILENLLSSGSNIDYLAREVLGK